MDEGLLIDSAGRPTTDPGVMYNVPYGAILPFGLHKGGGLAVICEYLDSQHRGRKLLPRKGRERWVALRLQAMADGLLDAAILTRYEGALRPEDKRWPDWIEGQNKKIEGVLAQLEAEANSLKGKPTIGTISVACALGYLDYRFAAMDWRAQHPKLAKWFNSIAETPAMKATQPPAA